MLCEIKTVKIAEEKLDFPSAILETGSINRI